jgi:hypothetical protein
MLAANVLHQMPQWLTREPPVQFHYFDRSRGETEENYFILGSVRQFSSILEFTAAALMTWAKRDGLAIHDFAELEIESCDPAPWLHYYDATARPGYMLCFPPVELLGFEPPPHLQRKLYLVPHLSGTEETFVCQSNDFYALLYWHTTG